MFSVAIQKEDTMQPINRFLKIVDAGNVRRFHTKPMVHDRNVAHHTFNMLLIADYAYDSVVPATMSRAILYHDLHEIYTGDIPHPLKHGNPFVKKAIKLAETEAELELGTHLHLSPEDEDILAYIDMLELLLHMIQEQMLGNQGNNQIIANAKLALANMRGSKIYVEVKVWANLNKLKNYLLEIHYAG